jgi:hypothetical protein
MKVTVDGVVFVPESDEELSKLLSSVYGKVWAVACHDPYDESAREFAMRILPELKKLNEIIWLRG